jgi:hypothetical protein
VNTPLLDFASHIEGKNARVFVWRDRIELDWKGLLSTGTKAGLAVMTVGLSYAKTGFTRSASHEVIPIRSVTSVAAVKGKGFQTTLRVITSGNTIDMRIAHSEAELVRTTLMQLVDGSHTSQRPAGHTDSVGAPAATSSELDVMGQLSKLAELHASGVLTNEEFTTKKAEMLVRL